MASKTLVFVIALIGVSTTLVSCEDTATTTPSPSPTTHDPATTAPTTSPDSTTGNPTTTVNSTSQPQPTATTMNDTEAPQSSTSPTATTVPPSTPKPTTEAPPEIGTWTVADSAKNLTCMKMTFKGTITRTKMTPILIPITAAADSSTCSDQQSSLVLQFNDENMTSIEVVLSFVMQDKKTSYLWSSSITYNQTKEEQVQVLFETPVGRSYQCNKQVVPLGATYSLTLEDMQLQPFASFANHDFGKAYSCVPPPSGPNAAVIVGLVLGGIILILLIAVISLCRKKKGPGRGYNNFS
ncbi:lysosome-associated membrane glycoprotein 2-like [Lytechinus variegatus]|uniref:lysosome-associated membrane glycoprotein 2-like n=1 Tax=Lytechinus variegatus TaxID=7654 RepID=UPI001BB11485|nr:lysosome-associated membrane glycoprotein 2-like [Lytechinus variegatus]